MVLPLQALATAVALAGIAGLRAFVPVFFLVHALCLNLMTADQINPTLQPYLPEIMASYPVLGLLLLVEVVLMKVPRVASALEMPFLLLRLLSAALVTFAVLPIADFATGLAVAGVLGGVGALPVMNLQAAQHTIDGRRSPGRQTIRLAASTLTDGLALGACYVTLQFPYVGLAVLHVGNWLATWSTQHWHRRTAERESAGRFEPPPEIPDRWEERGGLKKDTPH